MWKITLVTAFKPLSPDYFATTLLLYLPPELPPDPDGEVLTAQIIGATVSGA